MGKDKDYQKGESGNTRGGGDRDGKLGGSQRLLISINTDKRSNNKSTNFNELGLIRKRKDDGSSTSVNNGLTSEPRYNLLPMNFGINYEEIGKL